MDLFRYALFERHGQDAEEIGADSELIQSAVKDFGDFSQMIRLVSFKPFSSAEKALENINYVSEGVVHDDLKKFVELNLDGKKRKKCKLGVQEEKLGSAVGEAVGVSCVRNKTTAEAFRGIRLHFPRYIRDFRPGDMERAQLGLGHAYSRAKVKFNVNRADNMIIQSISLLDQLDKDLNTFAMRCKEWYGWHFPELAKIVTDNVQYARLVILLGNKSDAGVEAKLPQIEEVLGGDAEMAATVLEASRASMGTDVAAIDLTTMRHFAERVLGLAEYRESLQAYLHNRINVVAPNLSALIGDHVAARLISHAGSLTNLAKAPASTVQILGAEKALFRALKTRGNTPKYGLIYHSSFIGRASAKNKGRISRYLANKSSIAARLDCFSDTPSDMFGVALRDQVEDRLKYYDSGVVPPSNADVMALVLSSASKRPAAATSSMQIDSDNEDDVSPPPTKKSKTEKKEKKKEKKHKH